MNKICVEYIWLGGPDENYNRTGTLRYTNPVTLRSKTRVIQSDRDSLSFEEIPVWNYDGSSTNQAETKNSEIFIKPCAIFNDPFRGGNHRMVLCDTYITSDLSEPHPTNTRYHANQIFNKSLEQNPWFGIEQEFFLMNNKTGAPLGFDPNIPQGQYYCSVGNRNAFGRALVDQMMTLALTAGIKVSGMNSEVAPGQWEIQVGPVTGIAAADQLVVLRYIMDRVTEDQGVYIELHPKPLYLDSLNSLKRVETEWVKPEEWNGSGCHVNFSTELMRKPDGMSEIMRVISQLKQTHREDMKVYGDYNNLRLSGRCETSSMENFTYGVSDRSASIRIPSEVAKNLCGYLEDRRPSSLMDPYLVTSYLFKTCI